MYGIYKILVRKTKSSISPSFWFYHSNKIRFWSALWNGNLMLVSTDFVISIWFDLKSSSGEPSGNLKNWKQLIIAQKCRTWRLRALEKKLNDISINFIVCFIKQISILYRLYNNEYYKTKTNTSKKNSNYSLQVVSVLIKIVFRAFSFAYYNWFLLVLRFSKHCIILMLKN